MIKLKSLITEAKAQHGFDLTTASLIWNLYQAVNDTNKKKLNKLGVKALANIAFKIASKAGKSGKM